MARQTDGTSQKSHGVQYGSSLGRPRSRVWYDHVVRSAWVDGMGWASRPRLVSEEEWEARRSDRLHAPYVTPTSTSSYSFEEEALVSEASLTKDVKGVWYHREMTQKHAWHSGQSYGCPRIVKGILHTGVGRAAVEGPEVLVPHMGALSLVVGQKAHTSRARHSSAGFHLRRGMPIASHVTLRGDAFYMFWDTMVEHVLSAGRDFRGFSMRMSGTPGQVTLGLPDGLPHPSLQPWMDLLGLPLPKSSKGGGQKVLRPRLGWSLTCVTTARTVEETVWLMTALQLPIQPSRPSRK